MAKCRYQNKRKAQGKALYKFFANELGMEAEHEVYLALIWLRGDGEIQDFYQTQKHSIEDSRGIDFVVFVGDFWHPIPLQVKRSTARIKNHKKAHPEIPLIIVLKGDIRGQIRDIIRRFPSEQTGYVAQSLSDRETNYNQALS